MILLGDGEWDGLLAWLRERALADGRIDAADLDLLHIVERPAQVCEIVDVAYERQRAHGRHVRRRTGPATSWPAA